MHGAVVTLIARRMASSWVLLGCVLVTTFVTAALVAALASFGWQALPEALHRRLAADPASSITVIGLVGRQVAGTDTHAIGAAARTAFGSGSGQLDESVWSDPLALQATAAGPGRSQADVAAPDRIRKYAAIVSGTWPGRPRRDRPIPAAFPVAIARALHRGPHAVVTLRDLNTGKPVRLQISATYRQRYAASPYWRIDQIWTCGATGRDCVTNSGPIVVSPAAFGPGGLTPDQASWVVLPGTAHISPSDLDPLATRIENLRTRLQNTPGLGGLVVSTTMPQSLRATARTVTAAELVLIIGGIQLLLVGAFALVLATRLLASQREQESAVLSARGAARWHLAVAGLSDAIVVGAGGFLPAPLAGSKLAGLLARGWLLRGAGLRMTGIAPAAWVAAAGVFALCVAAMLGPVLWPPSVRTVQQRRSGRARLTTVVRAGGDVALLGLALIAVWQLISYPPLATPSGINPVLVIAPALAVAAVGIFSLRVLSVTTQFLDRAAARGRRAGATLASWQVSRRPVGQAGSVLLAVLAVATATLAISQYESWRRAVGDQAAFAVGSDVRLDTPTPVPAGKAGSIADAAGVRAATPVTVGTSSAGGTALALDPRNARAAVLLRPDESALPASKLWQRITPSGPDPGLELPGRPSRIKLTVSLNDSAGPKLAAAVTIAVQDRFGTVFDAPAGTLAADGRDHALVAVLSASGQAGYPLRLVGASMTYPLPPHAPHHAGGFTSAGASLRIGEISLAGPADHAFAHPFADGRQLASWRPAAAAPGLGGPSSGGSPPSVGRWGRAAAGSQELAFGPGSAPPAPMGHQGAPVAAEVTVTAPIANRALTGIATSAFLKASGAAVGERVPLSFGADSVPVTIVAAVTRFPTVSGPDGAVIVDQAAVQDVVASRWDAPLPVNWWWLQTAHGAVPPRLPAGTVVRDRDRETAALLADPLTAVPQQGVLAVAIAVAVLALLGFAVSVAARLRAGRLEGALLSALGMSRGAQTRRLCAEELMLGVPAAAAGVGAGAGLAHLLVPAVIPAPATAPGVLVVLPLPWLALIALAVATIPVLLAAIGGTNPGADLAGRLRMAATP